MTEKQYPPPLEEIRQQLTSINSYLEEVVEQLKTMNTIALGSYRISNDTSPPFRSLVVEPLNEVDVQPTNFLRETLGISAKGD